MNDEKIYGQIIKISILILAFFSILISIIVQDIYYGIAILYGGILSVLGFYSTVLSSQKWIVSANASRLVFTQYLVRYLLYGVAMYVGIHIGLNIFCILIGLLSISFAIKIHAVMY